jgi:hypothetical protein
MLQSQFLIATKTNDTFLLQRKRILLDLHHQESFHSIPNQHQEYSMLCSLPSRTAEFEATTNEVKEATIERRSLSSTSCGDQNCFLKSLMLDVSLTKEEREKSTWLSKSKI